MAGPVTLTPAQFAGTPAAAKGGTYRSYLNFLAKNRPAPAAGQSGQGLPVALRPKTPAQILAEAKTMLAPYMQSLIQPIQQQTAAAGNAITGYQATLAKALGQLPVQLGVVSDREASQLAAVDSATAQQIAAGGNATAGNLSSTLAARGLDTGPAATLASNAAGAGAASAGLAAGDLKNLIAHGSSGTDYASKLPYIGYLAGLQSERNVQYKGQTDIADAQAKAAGLLPTILNGLETRELQKQSQVDTQAYRAAQLGLSQDKAAVAQGNADRNYGLAVAKAGASQLNADRNYQVAMDRLGIAEKGLRLRTAAQQAKLNSGGFTPAQVSGLAKRAQKIAADAWNGKPSVSYQTSQPDANGNTHEIPLHGTLHYSYQEAMRDGLAAKIPLTIMQEALNSYWTKPGYDRDFKTGQWVKAGTGRPVQPYQVRNPGKAGAAQGAAYTADAAYARLAPTADRKGVSTSPDVLDFVGKIGRAYGQPLTIGTGTNHNEYVKGSSRVSDHWAGHAADIPATGATLKRLGYLALVQAGMSPQAAARAAQTGGLFNVGPYQIIFNSNIGGNHYNHLHVGVRGRGQT